MESLKWLLPKLTTNTYYFLLLAYCYWQGRKAKVLKKTMKAEVNGSLKGIFKYKKVTYLFYQICKGVRFNWHCLASRICSCNLMDAVEVFHYLFRFCLFRIPASCFMQENKTGQNLATFNHFLPHHEHLHFLSCSTSLHFLWYGQESYLHHKVLWWSRCWRKLYSVNGSCIVDRTRSSLACYRSLLSESQT